MNERMQDRLFAGCGIASVLLQLVGTAIATVGGKTHNLTISSTATHIAHAVAKPAGTAVWIGAYLELLGVGAFLAFAVWACVKLGGGLLGAIGQTRRSGYATLARIIARRGCRSRAPGRTRNRRPTRNHARHRQRSPLCRHLVHDRVLPARSRRARVSERTAGSRLERDRYCHRHVGRNGDLGQTVGQFTALLLFAWIVFASVAIARGERVLGGVGAVAQSA